MIHNIKTMTEIYNYPYIWLNGTPWTMTHCSWPVIIHEDKILLHISRSTGKYQFIWGRLDDELSHRENAIIRAEEVLWHRDIILEHTPLSIIGEIGRNTNTEMLILFHYKAALQNPENIWEWEWKTLPEIEQLAKDDMLSSENVLIASTHFLPWECLS